MDKSTYTNYYPVNICPICGLPVDWFIDNVGLEVPVCQRCGREYEEHELKSKAMSYAQLMYGRVYNFRDGD